MLIFIVTTAPGRSCFNRVERRIAPLSHPFSGLVFPYDSFENLFVEWYSDDEIDVEKLEEKNIEPVIPVINSISDWLVSPWIHN